LTTAKGSMEEPWPVSTGGTRVGVERRLQSIMKLEGREKACPAKILKYITVLEVPKKVESHFLAASLARIAGVGGPSTACPSSHVYRDLMPT
jgi:hypothetical protein